MIRERAHLGSTYRLQLNGLGLRSATDLVGYLHELGIETLYVSPLTRATSGSTHGYDVVDPSKLDPALGTMDDLEALMSRLDIHGMRLLVDIVPNHMSTSSENRWWQDVLRSGRQSQFASFFDIDWDAGDQKVVLPVLGRPFGEVLVAGELQIRPYEEQYADQNAKAEHGQGGLCVRYGDHTFPISPESERRIDGETGELSPDALERLLDDQHYRLTWWEVARDQVNYRRFFDIDGLVGVRVEEPDVYRATHDFVLDLARDSRIAGLRVDHVDGLANPDAYLQQLDADLQSAPEQRSPAILVEKILSRDEELPAWPVDGTTGYEFADLATGVLTEPDGAGVVADLAMPHRIPFRTVSIDARLQILDEAFVGQLSRLAEMFVRVAASERHGRDLSVNDMRLALRELTAHMTIYRTYLVSDCRPSRSDRARIDDAAAEARERLKGEPEKRALEVARRMLLSLRLDPGTEQPLEKMPKSWARLATLWQQLTSATTAKGVEDTGLYRFPGLLSSGDVGSDPGQPSVTVEHFHQAMSTRCSSYPSALSGTSTHDSKRSEDVRSRIAVLSEVPERWSDLVEGWRIRHAEIADAFSRSGGTALDIELALYQTIVGVWPLLPEQQIGLTDRVQEYMLKAAREAKIRTSWTHPNDDFESALRSFVESVLDRANDRFHQEMESLSEDLGRAGAVNSLALLILKTTAPGVPDFYQGTEVWRPLLVDPDNRSPVDYASLRATLSSLPATREVGAAETLLTDWRSGAVKAFVMRAALGLRKQEPDLFRRGDYIPLEARGRWAPHVVAFARRTSATWTVSVVPRFSTRVAGLRSWPIGAAWGDTEVLLPPDAPHFFIDAITGLETTSEEGDWDLPDRRRLRVADVLAALPVGLLLANLGPV